MTHWSITSESVSFYSGCEYLVLSSSSSDKKNIDHNNRSIFARLGGFIVRRKYLLIVAWIIAFGIIIPVVFGSGNNTSLQQTSTTGPKLESDKATDIITAQFSKTVSNSSLIIVVTTSNASSQKIQ